MAVSVIVIATTAAIVAAQRTASGMPLRPCFCPSSASSRATPISACANSSPLWKRLSGCFLSARSTMRRSDSGSSGRTLSSDGGSVFVILYATLISVSPSNGRWPVSSW